MGIFEKIFGFDKNEEDLIIAKELDVDKEIDTIILILQYLSTLNVENVDNLIKRLDKQYDKSILNKLIIDIDDDSIADFKKYFSSMCLGYGSEKLADFKKELYMIAKDKNEVGRNKPEVVEELIKYAKTLVDQYELIIKRFNEVIKTINHNTNMSEAEKVVMRDYWVNNYMQEELGYPIDLEVKIQDMIDELESLEFGGYGNLEIEKFKNACKQKIAHGEKIGNTKKQILSEIEVILFTPLKNRYKTNLEVIKLRLAQIENSNASQEEIEKITKKALVEFKEKNGHELDLDVRVEEMKKSLRKFAKYGYGDDKIKEFSDNVEKIMKKAEKVAKSTEEILKEIENEYYFFKRRYEECYNTLQNILKNIDQREISEEEKDFLKEAEIRLFKDEMGHPIDIESRLSEMKNHLMKLDKGGYGPSKIEEFEKRSREIIENNNYKKQNTLRSIKDIEVLYKVLLKAYEVELQQLEDTIERISADDSLTEKEVEKSVGELKLAFELETGHHLEFNEKLEDYKKMLSNLPGGGYGMEALTQFEEECKRENETLKDDTVIHQVMKNKANILKNRYLTNKELFDKWFEIELSICKEEEKENKKVELTNEISYMLSLSPKALDKYFREDDKNKKEAMEKHNFMAAFKYLARKEAESQNDKKIYKKRISAYEKDGYNPYTEEDIKTAIENLTNIDLLGEEQLKDDEKILSVQDYIDSTLLMKINSISLREKL